ncbi:MAG TPA: peptidylprolyl isomerase [Rubrivivax sp.]|jgi:FKBP-type peptidyl-prolyl cis-trans isomerase SlyD|nr:peptidylprolyl isomerase [Rhodoferax sp.]MCL4737628.1 peptidylprolyl isomerase [Burkholderiaceae bacterium]MCP5287764.1 peptidylprolyl isomerase [Burkholderiaceae bacterium]HMQ71265.1 peptidylprolyl isomerase [Rubrivivax sp.]HMR71023.1 peptidylprolyl isomerase [Rubrivivax sp.]
MLITAPCVVTLTWTLTDAQDRALDALETPTEFFFGGDDLLAAVEDAIAGRAAGFETRVQIEPEQAFGDYQPERVCFEPRALFPAQLEPGMVFEGLPAGAKTPGMAADALYVVTEVYPEHVVLDANHPLAGMAIRLAIKVEAVREASDDEIEAGSVGRAGVSVLTAAAAPKRLQ